MSLYISLFVVSDETADSDTFESMAVDLSEPLGWNGATVPASAAAHVAPPSGGPSCLLPIAA